MNVQVKTSDGRIYDVSVSPNATVADLQQALFTPFPVPKNSSVMARTRLLDPRERVQNVVHHDLFLVGPKPEAVKQQFQNQQNQANNNTSASQQRSPQSNSSRHHHHSHQPQQQQQNPYSLGGGHHHSGSRTHHSHGNHHHHNSSNNNSSLDHAKQAVNHLENFVASPQGNQNQPQFSTGSFQQPPLPAHFRPQQQYQQQQQQQQQVGRDNYNDYFNNNNNNNSATSNSNNHSSPPPPPQHNPAATPPPPVSASATAPTPSSSSAPKPVIVSQMPKNPRDLLPFIRQTYEEFNQQVLDPNVSAKYKGIIGEESMKLLYKLDELIDLDADLKPERKQLVKDIQKMQDMIDGKKH